MTAPKSLIINSPYVCPQQHWRKAVQNSSTTPKLEQVAGRRPASYEIFDTRNNTSREVELPLVNQIRTRVDAWRTASYPGITSITRSLLEHWHDSDARPYPFYFCQLEAIETLIWWMEALPDYKQGIAIESDGGAWERLCSKMATGTGKTTVMAMLITWQVLNTLAFPKRHKEFSSNILIIAPGLTVKERLQVLKPGATDNYYDAFSLCPNASLRHTLNQMEVLIENWHSLMPLKEPERSVQKKGAENDEAFTRRVLGKLAGKRGLLVINDEAHHAYRKPAELKISKAQAAEQGIDLDEATRWIEGLDRIHKTRRITRCFDLSATPFAPTGKRNTESALFPWVISDFGLYDAIEAGLVKTPRVVVRDDALPNAKTYRPKLYHLYAEADVAEDLNRKGAQATEPLPELVQTAYTLLGADWRAALHAWQAAGHTSPPVMLTVCNRTETAARVEHYFRAGDAHWAELQAPERTLRVDSRVLEKAEVGEASTADKGYEAQLQAIIHAANIPITRKQELQALKKEALLREIIDNVGKRGTAGQDLQNVISVAMLSEGWDAKNVTHIMGLRAFSSQLLCEQVIGRGLRRVSYDRDENGLFIPEYVNVFGVPLSIFQDVGDGGAPPPPPKPSTQIKSLPERHALEIRWPNVLRIDTVVRPELHIDWSQVEMLTLDPALTPVSADLAPALGGATALDQVHGIDLALLPEGFRLQRLVFRAAQKAFDQLRAAFKGNREYLLLQLIRLVEQFMGSEVLRIPSDYHHEPLRQRILIGLNIDIIVQHLLRFVTEQNSERLEPIFDTDKPQSSTADMPVWYSTKPCLETTKSQISHVVDDSTWEHYVAGVLEKSELVRSYAKNDHLGFQVLYLWRGSKRRYVPDFLIRLANGKTLVLEIKGKNSEQAKAKRAALGAWVAAINSCGGFGEWCADVIFEPAKIYDSLAQHGEA